MGLKDIFRRQKTKDDLPEHIINHHQTAEKLNSVCFFLHKRVKSLINSRV